MTYEIKQSIQQICPEDDAKVDGTIAKKYINCAKWLLLNACFVG